MGQMPFDCMHDCLEKVGPMDSHSIIMAFVRNNKFTLAEYNSALKQIRLKDYEVGDRPHPVKAGADKLSGKALAIAQHIRLMPLVVSIISDHSNNCELVEFLVTLHSVNEFVMADSISPSDAFSLQKLLVRYMSLRKICSEKYGTACKEPPKLHYLEHYPAQLLAFGPLTAVWTARNESRHRDFVNWSQTSKNFVNVLKTLSGKNQKKLASRHKNSIMVNFMLLFLCNLLTENFP